MKVKMKVKMNVKMKVKMKVKIKMRKGIHIRINNIMIAIAIRKYHNPTSVKILIYCNHPHG